MPLFAIAIPYGLGAVALLLLLYPLVQKKRIGFVATFFLSAIITATVEFLCAALIVAVVGHNDYWDYSSQPFNLLGYTCLETSLLFGVGSVIMLWLVFPWTEKLLTRIRERHINIAFWLLFIGYILSQIYIRIIKNL